MINKAYFPKPFDILDRFREDVREGLQDQTKRIPNKYFYDAKGSELFQQICGLEEYYLTRCETEILRTHHREICAAVGPECALIELGSGTSREARILLATLENPALYVPIDISWVPLTQSSAALEREFPQLNILPLCADYSQVTMLPPQARESRRRVFFFPGSTIGNFTQLEALAFLRQIRNLCLPGDAMLIGFDLIKDSAVLHAAYNDKQGVTAAFNLNLLERLRHELGAEVDLDGFYHRAFYDSDLQRVEMHLVSSRFQVMTLEELKITFWPHESILTELSCKYSRQSFANMAKSAGFAPQLIWTDSKGWFATAFLTVE